MSDSVESQVAELKSQAEAAVARQQRLQAQKEAAEAECARLLVKLKEDFGVSSVEEAQALLEKLDAELSSEITKVRAALDAARA